MPETAFVLLAESAAPDPAAVVAAAQQLGLDLALETDSVHEGIQSFRLGDATLMSMLVAAPHPDAPEMPYGPTSPRLEEAVAAPAHLIATALKLDGDARARDAVMAGFTAALIRSTPAIAAMLGHGIVFHKAALFADLAALGVQEGALPPELAVDITAARESETHMSFLTHNMPRYGREDFYITCPIQGRGALDFLFSLVRWMLSDPDKHLPTGDTIGRTASEKVEIQRVPNPADATAQVIRLDLT